MITTKTSLEVTSINSVNSINPRPRSAEAGAAEVQEGLPDRVESEIRLTPQIPKYQNTKAQVSQNWLYSGGARPLRKKNRGELPPGETQF